MYAGIPIIRANDLPVDFYSPKVNKYKRPNQRQRRKSIRQQPHRRKKR